MEQPPSPSPRPLPAVVGLDRQQALTRLKAAGFPQVHLVFTPGQPDQVLGQMPAAGSDCQVEPQLIIGTRQQPLASPLSDSQATSNASRAGGPGWLPLLWYLLLAMIWQGGKRRHNSRAGNSLLEVCVAIVLLSLTLLGIYSLYIAMVRANRTSENQRELTLALSTACAFAKDYSRKHWPITDSSFPPDPAVAPYLGSLDLFSYQIDDYGRQLDPVDPSRWLELKQLRVSVYETAAPSHRQETYVVVTR